MKKGNDMLTLCSLKNKNFILFHSKNLLNSFYLSVGIEKSLRFQIDESCFPSLTPNFFCKVPSRVANSLQSSAMYRNLVY